MTDPTPRERRLEEASRKLCMWIRHTVPTWTSEVDRYLEATEAALSVEGEASAPTPSPAPEATHRCKVCGARWRLNPPTKAQPDGSWSLVYPSKAGKCCDNVAMGSQIEAIGDELRCARCGEEIRPDGKAWMDRETHTTCEDSGLPHVPAGSPPSPSPSGEEIIDRWHDCIHGASAERIGACRPCLIYKIDSALSSLRGERDRLDEDLSNAYKSVARLERENSALRTRADGLEADVAMLSQALANTSMLETDLAFAREALRIAERVLAAAPHPVTVAWQFGLKAVRAALEEGAPPAPAPATETVCEHCGRPLQAHIGIARRCSHMSAFHWKPKPVAQEDAPAPDCKGFHAEDCPESHRAAEPSADADLEGLIRETRLQILTDAGPYPHSREAILRSFASEVSRLTREPLEKACEEAGKLADSLAADVSEAERKLSEVTQERDRLRDAIPDWMV